MPTPTKSSSKKGVPAAQKPVELDLEQKFSLPKPAAGNYVHFSDKMTTALKNIGNVIDENKGTLDSIQDMAVELTRTVQELRVVVMRYVNVADKILEIVVPIMDKLPVFPASLKNFAKEALELSNKIGEASALAEKVLPGVEASLLTADVSGLQASTKDVAGLTRALKEITLDDNKK